MIKCPNCGLFNPDNALWCDCGYHFNTGQIDLKRSISTQWNFRRENATAPSRPFTIAAIASGVVGIFIFAPLFGATAFILGSVGYHKHEPGSGWAMALGLFQILSFLFR